MSGAIWELQKALRTRLGATSAVTTLLSDGANSILDDVPENEAFNYITIGDIASNGNETMTELGFVHTVTLHAWTSRSDRGAGRTRGYEGRKAARDILDALYDALNHATLTLTGFANTNTEYQFSDVYRDDDQTYHGVIRFRVVTEPA